MKDAWIVDGTRNERLPYYTRANAGAVVVDVGAMNSRAVVVSRELGIPSVLSLTTGTAQLRDGMEVTVDGTAGTVTVESATVPGAVTV